MDLFFAAVVTVVVAAGLLAALVTLIIHPQVDQLLSDEWLPEPEGARDLYSA